jgi:hypothetical protein
VLVDMPRVVSAWRTLSDTRNFAPVHAFDEMAPLRLTAPVRL